MSTHTMTLSVLAGRDGSEHVFGRVFTLAAVLAPTMLIVLAFALSAEAVVRTQIIVHGLETTVFALAAALIARSLTLLGIRSVSTQSIAAMQAVGETGAA